LSKAEKAELMHFMIELLSDDDFELSQAWKTELDRREEALNSGVATGKPAKDIIAKYLSR
ncbi:MAG: addiction module protein, partial [Saprospiraceae bacterium]|nr:addiction module protein [Saprospiraceae bacterium]